MAGLTTFRRTKVRPPVLPPGLMPRPALIAKLDAGAESGLVLVSAPGGYGKTSLLLQWAARRDNPLAWVELDQGDNDLGLLTRYILAAVAEATGEVWFGRSRVLEGGSLPDPDSIAAELIERFEALSEDVILVLENTHFMIDEAVWRLIWNIVRRLPYHLLIALESRRDPLLPLARLRGRSRVLEIRERDLAFTPAESRSFLEDRLGAAAAVIDVGRLVERTEGWPVALHLAAVSIEASSDPASAAARFTGRDRYIMDYLVDEIVGELPRGVQDILLKTSVVRAFNRSLCSALLGEGESGSELDPLAWVDSNPLVVPLDTERRWYRHHHLLRDLLQERLQTALGPHAEEELHERAARWFVDKGMVDEALEQARASGNEDLLSRIVEGQRQEAINTQRWQDLERWLRLLPPGLLERRPALLLARAQCLQRQYHFAACDEVLDQLEPLLSTARGAGEDPALLRALEGEAASLHAQSLYWQGDWIAAFEMAKRSLELLPRAAWRSRGLAALYLAGAVELRGDLAEAIRLLEDALVEDGPDAGAYATPLLVGLCNLRHIAGDLAATERAASYLLGLAEDLGLDEGRGWAESFLGRIAYERNDLDRAKCCLEAATMHPHSGHLIAVKQAHYALALAYQAEGEDEAAERTIDALKRHVLSLGHRSVSLEADSFRSRLRLMRGECPRPDLWVAAIGQEATYIHLAVDYELPHLTFAWTLICSGEETDLDEAERLLDRLEGAARRIQSTLRRVQVGALASLLWHARGDESRALRRLYEAVELAREGGFVRTFLDFGPVLEDLLYRLAVKHPEDVYLARLVEAADAGHPAATGPAKAAESVTARADRLLTDRESHILALLAQRLSNKEIAQRLYISPLTVKRHTINIYGKLGAANRRDAVIRAAQLGLVDDVPVGVARKDGQTPA